MCKTTRRVDDGITKNLLFTNPAAQEAGRIQGMATLGPVFSIRHLP